MATHFRIYTNDLAGGPIDDSTVYATRTTKDVTINLPPGSDALVLCRPFDTVTGFENRNLDCVRRVVTDAAGEDVTGLPAAPTAVYCRPIAGGVRVHWMHNPIRRWCLPAQEFDVWLTPGASVDYLDPPAGTLDLATSPLFRRRPVRSVGGSYFLDLAGLVDGTLYAIGVRARNAVGTEENTTAVAAFTADVSPPTAAVHGSASPGFSARMPLPY